jgi:hypothetical protein
VNLSCEGLCECWLRSFLVQMLAGGGASRSLRAPCSFLLPPASISYVCETRLLTMLCALTSSQLSAMDVSVRTTMKGAAKCDKHCELQNSVNRQGLERILRLWDIPEGTPASVSMPYCSSGCRSLKGLRCCDVSCLTMRESALLRHQVDKALRRASAH